MIRPLKCSFRGLSFGKYYASGLLLGANVSSDKVNFAFVELEEVNVSFSTGEESLEPEPERTSRPSGCNEPYILPSTFHTFTSDIVILDAMLYEHKNLHGGRICLTAMHNR